MLTTERFGSRLKELRMEKGLSQRQLAERMTVSNATIANWEVGKRLPDLTMLARLAECLGVEPSLLLDELHQPEGAPRVIVVEDAENTEEEAPEVTEESFEEISPDEDIPF